ncbi:hypothetical protein [Intrasporangium sp. DVR]|uniref:hypothetical protein n=1 Tax=Intrasporangium sp. DVR TaxID=3127867 RepID=UPI00313A616D
MSLNAAHDTRLALRSLIEAADAGHDIAGCSCAGCVDHRGRVRHLVEQGDLPDEVRVELALILAGGAP